MNTEYFTRNLRSANETYFEHWRNAMKFAMKLLYAFVCCFIHAWIPLPPPFPEKTASGIIRQLYDEMVVHRIKEKSIT